MFDLSDQWAVLTGGSRGLGSYMAKALARAGANLVLTARDRMDCEATAEAARALGSRVNTYSLDVRLEDSIRSFAARLQADAIVPSILVNNAGCNVRKPLSEVTWDDWNRVVDTNLRGTFFVIQALAPAMVDAGYGRIVNIGSVTSVFGYAGLGPYCASRGGTLQMTRSIADELGPAGITANVLAPGWFRTEQNKVLYESPEWVEYITDRIPVKRPGQPTDLDGAVVFLSSRESEYVTGQILLVDGGITTGSTRATSS